jgi:2-polyprenyl-6-hydroxyphenyl methylase/3-demethylubiquinone-9 3-methyltransferase
MPLNPNEREPQQSAITSIGAGSSALCSEYVYAGIDPNHSHAYLLSSVEQFLRSLPAASRVLDFGCGNGALIAGFAGNGLELHGVDSSRSGIRYATEQWRDVKFHLADVTALMPPELPESHFDAIVSTEVIEHIYEPRKFVRNAHSLLKPGGRFLITTPYHGYLKNLALAFSGRMDSHFTALWDFGHIKFWSEKTLAALLQEAGFQNLKFSGVGRLPGFWKSMVVQAQKPA